MDNNYKVTVVINNNDKKKKPSVRRSRNVKTNQMQILIKVRGTRASFVKS